MRLFLPLGRKAGLTVILGSGVILASTLFASPPSWWSERGATNTNPADDYAAANLGQLKQFASKAADELNAHLPGGAGTTINNLVASWSQPPAAGVTRDDYAAVNLGQLKSIAKPFYDRLIAVSYTTSYPWNAPGHAIADDYALANLGQLKQLFSFDLTSTDAAHDVNQDGIPDWWASYYGVTNASGLALRGDGLTNLESFQQGLNPNDLFDGHAPMITIVSGNGQGDLPDHVLFKPFKVQVDDWSGRPLKNATVTFGIASGGGALANTSDSTTWTSPLHTTTDAEGH